MMAVKRPRSNCDADVVEGADLGVARAVDLRRVHRHGGEVDGWHGWWRWRNGLGGGHIGSSRRAGNGPTRSRPRMTSLRGRSSAPDSPGRRVPGGRMVVAPAKGTSGTRPYADAMSCPSCGAPVAAGARFCASCGHALHSRSDERRIATVLFADLVGFTTLSETRDPEQVKNLVDSLLPAAGRATSRRSVARSTRSSATPSSPSSARRSPTRTTPSGPCGPRCGCRRRCRRTGPRPTRRSTCASASTPARCSSARCGPAATTRPWATW